MSGGNRSPYRPPCGYSADEPERYWLGAPWQHYQAGASALTRYKNTTTVPNYDTTVGGLIAPYMLPNPEVDDAECGGTNQPLCGPPVQPALVNTYAAYDPASPVNLAACRKVGFKTVFARKYWQGRFGFTDADNCNACPRDGSPSSTKYLTISWTATISQDPGGTPDNVVTFTASGTCSVDRYSGRVTGSVDQTYTESNYWYDPGIGQTACIDMEGAPDFAGDLTDAFAMTLCDGTWIGGADLGGLADILNAGSGGGVTITEASATATTMTISYTSQSSPSAPLYSCDISLTLSNGYTSDNVNTDVNTLLAKWNLADDIQYPWRTDEFCTSGPYLSYDETTTNVPFGFVSGGPPCPVSGPVTGATATGTSGMVTGTSTFNWNPAAVEDYAEATVTFSGTFDDGLTNTGNILGAPLCASACAASYDPYWDSNFQVWHFDVAWQIIGWGAYNDGSASHGPFPNATQWTNLDDSASLLPGAFAVYGSSRGGGGLPDGFNPDSTYLPGFLVKSKYAEVILLTAPSHDFARPCGDKDASTIDQSTITTCYGFDSPCNFGDLRWTFGVEDCPIPPDTNGEWNDNKPKGDWLMVNWAFNFRQTPLSVTGAWSGVTFTPECSTFVPCCPAVVYLSNDGEESANSQTFTLAGLALDDCYGARWSMMPLQWMTDPLWQVPVQSEACHTASGQWDEDDGSGHADGDGIFYYPQRPFEEARASVPAGAPALPGGCYLPGMSVDDINTNGSYPAEPNRVIYPPNGGACFQPCWTWAINRLNTVLATGHFSCDYANPFAVCSDNTELSPP